MAIIKGLNLLESLTLHLNDLSDPRVLGRSSHKLLDIMVIGVLAVICHAESWYEMAEFGKSKEKWLRQFLELPNGIPSHDTFARVFGLIDPREFEICFMKWVNEVRTEYGEDTICIDGKTLKGTMVTRHGQVREILTTVSAWSTVSGLVLGQLKSSGCGSCEVTTAKELVEMLDVKGLTVVADAGIGRESVARRIREKKGDYLFPVKRNSSGFYQRIEEVFKRIDQDKIQLKGMDSFVLESKGHGRKETRSTMVLPLQSLPEGFNLNRDGTQRYEGLSSIGRITYERVEKENRPFINKTILDRKSSIAIGRRENEAPSETRTKTDTRYFVTSLKGDAKFLSEKIRLQWSIENQLHWVLDVSMGEDGNRTRNKVAANNLATVRRIAINLVKQDKSKSSIRVRLKKAGWDEEYLEKILFGRKLS